MIITTYIYIIRYIFIYIYIYIYYNVNVNRLYSLSMCPCPSRHFEVDHNLPVVVHARDADADTLEVLTLR